MGTRCLTIVYDHGKPIVNLYRQYDGYPSGHGAELAEFLGQFAAVTNGIAVGETRKTANGMGCLAAQLVAHFKQSVGGFYIHSVEDTDCGQDFEYHVYEKAGEICVQVKDRGCNMFGLTLSDRNDVLFDGAVMSFDEFCTSEDE
jgi:hypothetical protein